MQEKRCWHPGARGDNGLVAGSANYSAREHLGIGEIGVEAGEEVRPDRPSGSPLLHGRTRSLMGWSVPHARKVAWASFAPPVRATLSSERIRTYGSLGSRQPSFVVGHEVASGDCGRHHTCRTASASVSWIASSLASLTFWNDGKINVLKRTSFSRSVRSSSVKTARGRPRPGPSVRHCQAAPHTRPGRRSLRRSCPSARSPPPACGPRAGAVWSDRSLYR